ncbi:MAG: cell surface protein SprA [Chitinispirillales bacterium]|nr:cell surface protein SprA [Chitinispirillales bacterium]
MKRFIKWITVALALAAPLIFAQGLRYEPPVIDGHEPPFKQRGGSPFSSENPAILKNNGTMFFDTVAIDFEKRQLTFMRQDKEGNAVQSYHYGELGDYINDSRTHSFYEEWYNKLTAEAKQDLGEPPAPKLQWELAVHYPPWAQRLLGNDPPRLKIEGSLKLTVAYDYTRIIIDKDTTTDFIPLDFEPEYEFAIRGSVGRLISVNITHSRKNGFDLSEDPLKNFKVEYKESYEGELEDEIVQEIVAGYTGFDMPGTNLSGYSEKHDGLFGLKARAKIGPLMLTTVLSHAQGEAMTRELGGRNDPNSITALRDNEFIKNRYFFLDNVYKDYNNKVYSITNPDRNAARPPRITQFQVFVSIQCNETSNSTVRRYKADMNGSEVCFRMLTENQEYTVDLDRGFVRFEYPVKEDEIIAVAMTTVDGSLNRGRIVPINTPNNETIQIEMLKPNGLDELTDASNPLFGLMWRNVYYLPTLDDSKLDLFYLDPAMGDTIRHVDVGGRSVLISNAMGLTDEQGRARIENIEIFKADKQELIIPPWNTSINGNEPFANTALGSMKSDLIYRFGLRNTAMRDYVAKFGILTNGIMKRTTYDDLGWNILQGTVIVKTNSGTLLVEGEDYNLDYEMGILDLLSTRAKSAESILITYQRESDFVLEKKVFAGLRGEMRLPFISDNSFMAASLLYQSAATTAGDLPQLGNEPFSKLHLSFNTSLDFQPEWMTKAINFIPLVKTETESSAKLDFEIVHSRMNPNTSVDKGAYIDDFERTKDGYTLSMRHPVWHPSHYPFKYSGGAEGIADSMLNKLRIPVWDFYWYTPNAYDDARKINRFDVWKRDPNNSRYNSSDTYIDILRLNATPASREHPFDVQDRFRNSYASITSSFGRTGLNMENHRYLEIVVNPRGSGQLRRKGKLMIQIGTFSHDQVRDGGPPNETFDLEDPTYQNKPAQLSLYDKGLNGRDMADKFYMIPNAASDATGWDTLSRSRNTELLVSPRGRDNPSGDLFRKYDKDNLNNFRFVNGTWENSFYDDENIDGDGIPRINVKEKYYSYEINLDVESSPYIDGTSRVVSENGWRYYRIPLKEVLDGISVVKDSASDGAPDWAKARGIRLVWYDFDERVLTSENELLIAGIELSGNYWEPSAGSESKIEATSISNYEDMAYYNSVYGTIVKPKSGEITPEEKSLRLNFINMGSGDTATVRRQQVGNAQNISGYDSVSIKVYSMASYGEDLKFVFRFGSDDSTYYEYSAPLNWGVGWRTLTFSLQEFSDLKLSADFENAPINAVSGRLRVVAPANKRPNFTAITFMAIGAVCARGPINAEIWVNELIATGGRVLSGVAARVNIATQWADFLTLGAGISFTDGDFKTMTDATLGGSDRSELSANINAVMKLDKFMPEEWGVSIPVGGSISGALSRPTVKPQSDIRLLGDDGNPDGFLDMADDAFKMMLGSETGGDRTRAQRFETFAATRNAYTSFEKTSESENPFVGFTLDRIKTDVSYNQTSSYTGKGPQEDPDSADYIKTDTTVTYTGGLHYDLSPRDPPSWTSYAPFETVKWMPTIYQKYTLNLLPSTINFDVAEIQHRTEKRNDPKLNVYDFTTRTFDMRHGMNVEYSPIDPLLAFGYTLRLDRDLANLPTDDWNVMMDSTFANIFGLNTAEGEKWDTYGMLYGERGRTQSASAKLTPQFVTWMTHSAEYTADYTGLTTRRDNDSTRYLNAGVSTALKFRTSLLLSELFKPSKGKTAAAKDSTAKDSTGKALRIGYWAFISNNVNKLNMRSINFEYDVATDLKNGFISSTYLADTAGMSNYDFIRYQMGLRRGLQDYLFGTLGDEALNHMQYRLMTGVENDLYRNDQSKGSWAARFSTSFSIPDPFKVDITGVSFGWGREFCGQPDTAYIDTTVVLPEVRAGANTKALTKFSLVKRYFSDLGASSAFSFKNSRKESKDRTDTTATIDFQPLISFEGKFVKWPSLTANYRFGTTNTTINAGGKDAETGIAEWISTENTNRNSHTLTLVYAFTGAGSLKEIRLRKWVIPVQGKTSVGLGVNWETSEIRTNKIGNDDDVVTKESNFNYSPYIDYVFTKNIKGQARYLGSHKNQDGKRTLNQRFELTAEVTFQ